MVANIKQKGTLAISRPRQACVKFSPRKAALLLLNFFQTFQVHIQSLMPKKLIKLPIASSFLLAYSLLSGGLILLKNALMHYITIMHYAALLLYGKHSQTCKLME